MDIAWTLFPLSVHDAFKKLIVTLYANWGYLSHYIDIKTGEVNYHIENGYDTILDGNVPNMEINELPLYITQLLYTYDDMDYQIMQDCFIYNFK